MYHWVKFIHVATVTISISLFFVRGVWMIMESPRLQRRWVKVLPHVNDATLLASALVLAFLAHQYPFVDPWLTIKVLLLVVYIGLGMVALRFGRTRGVRIASWVGAMAVFGYIVLVALTKSVWPPGVL